MGKSNLDKEEIEHPSFAVININRAQIGGGHKKLFDSPFKHYHIITLEISPARLVRSLHGDSIFHGGKAPYISVAMSQVQFSEMVLNAGMHGGTPCTVEWLNGKQIPEPPARDVKKLWADEVKRDFKDVSESADAAEKAVEDLLAKDRITKADVKALKDIIYTMAQDIRSNMPWMQERFQEAMEKTVAEAKGEINAHAQHIIKTTGLQALAGGALPALEMQGEGEGSTKK
jgi:hypothetical protein